jgi:hypothetical protein
LSTLKTVYIQGGNKFPIFGKKVKFTIQNC